MNIIKAFNLNGKNIPVNIINKPEGPLFRAIDIGQALEITNIRSSLATLDDSMKVVESMDTITRGKQKCSFLTEEGLFICIFQSRTSAAKIFKKWVMKVIQEIEHTGKYDIKDHAEASKQEKLLHGEIAEKSHSDALRFSFAFTDEHVVYFGRLVNQTHEDGTDLYKIGESRDMKSRGGNIGADYGQKLMLIAVFPVHQSLKFEYFLLKNPLLAEFKTTFAINGHTRKEVFRMNFETREMCLKLMKDNFKDYQGFNRAEALEAKRLDVQQSLVNEIGKCDDTEMKKILIDSLQKSYNQTDKNPGIQEEATTIAEPNISRPADPCVQKYNTELKLIESYNSERQAARENVGAKSFEIAAACKNNSVYKNFRWFKVDREDKDEEQQIPPTEIVQKRAKDFVAKVDPDTMSVVDVFPNATAAAESMGLAKGAMSYAINKYDGHKAGFLWYWWSPMSDDLKKTFSGDIEKLSLANISKQILQLDAETYQTVGKPWKNMQDVVQQYKTSHKTLKKCIAEDKNVYLLLHGFRWKFQ